MMNANAAVPNQLAAGLLIEKGLPPVQSQTAERAIGYRCENEFAILITIPGGKRGVNVRSEDIGRTWRCVE